MERLRALLPAIRAMLALILGWVVRRCLREGRLEAENEQLEKDQLALRQAADARRGVDRSLNGVRDDPRNRDAR